MKKSTLFLFVLIASICLPSFTVFAAPYKNTQDIPSLTEPYRIVLYKQGARFMVKSEATVCVQHGQKHLVLSLPAGAKDIWSVVTLHGATDHNTIIPILAQRVEVAAPLPITEDMSSAVKQRQLLQTQYDTLQGTLAGLEAQERLWLDPACAKSNTENSAVNAQNIKKVAAIIADLAKERMQIQRELAGIEAQLKMIPPLAVSSQKLILSFAAEDAVVKEGTVLQVAYAYTLENTSWKPVYAVRAKSDGGNIAVELMAEITQNSGMDWKSADIVLSTANTVARTPAPIYPWVVRKIESPMPRGHAAPTLLRSASSGMRDATNEAGLPSFTQESTGMWSLPKGYVLPEGKSTVLLQQEQEDIALVRIARPTQNNDKVWLSAVYACKENFLPVGEAVFFLDGVSVGEGMFAPKNGKVTLFFGADPLMSVSTKADIRQSDSDGLIDTEQVWTWNWEYTVRSQRKTVMPVRIEEPATQLEDASMQVAYENMPEAEMDAENTLVWKVEVPAEGFATVQHKVTVRAPAAMQVFPGR